MRSLAPLLLSLGAILPAEELQLHRGGHALVVQVDNLVARMAGEALPVWRRGHARTTANRMLLLRTIAFRPTHDPHQIAQTFDLTDLRPGPIAGTWLAEAATPRAAAAVTDHLQTLGWVRWAEPQVSRTLHRRTLPNDPSLSQQWHLRNDGASIGAVAGNDMNVEPAWTAGYTGSGRLIAILDGSFDRNHPDLAAVFRTDLALKINATGSNGNPWTTRPADFHATLCAGLAAARGGNGIGVAGVAYNAQVLPIDLLTASATDSHESQALGHHLDLVDVSSNSWGPPDDGVTTDSPGSLALETLENAVTTGRGGKGTIIVWAAGNGRSDQDNLAYDGYASDHRVLAIGALTIGGQRTAYSESGPALFAVAPGGSGTSGMVSTIPVSRYSLDSDGLAGTSFSTPLVAGVAALVIEANPALTWRDVRWVLATTATMIHPEEPAWTTSTEGHPWHPAYGFGRINAAAATAAAVSTTPLPEEAADVQGTWSGSLGLPDGVGPTEATASVSFLIAAASDYRIESVAFSVTPEHAQAGQLEYTLTSPRGRSVVVERRIFDVQPAQRLVFEAVGYLDESPNGTWTLAVRDRTPRITGRITAADLTIRGYRTGAGRISGQVSPAVVVGTSPSGSTSPAEPPPPETPVKSSSGKSGCGSGGLLGLLLMVPILAWSRRKV